MVTADHGLSPACARELGRSLSRLQLGETGEGRIAHQIESYQAPGVDADYRACLKALVAEEGRHARLLGQAVRMLGERTLARTWTADLFTRVRGLWGVRTKLFVMLTAELVAIALYRALVVALPASSLRRALAEVCDDERRHLTLHLRFFALHMGPLRAGLFRCLLRVLAGVALVPVCSDHLRTLGALGVAPLSLWQHMGRELDQSFVAVRGERRPRTRGHLGLLGLLALCFTLLSCARTPRSSIEAGLVQRAEHVWTHDEARQALVSELARENPEWRLLHGMFSALTFANLALSERERATEYVALLDRVIDELRQFAAQHGDLALMLPYGNARSFVQKPPASAFVRGELSLMIGARQLVVRELSRRGVAGLEERPELTVELAGHVQGLHARMERSAVLCAESYPDECWTFCSTVTLLATRMLDALTGADHQAFVARALDRMRERLTDAHTGLLVSSFTLDGDVRDGPEGSTLWWAIHALSVLDPELARAQYGRGTELLGMSVLGHGFAREWPLEHEGVHDIDVGPMVPALDAAAASSAFFMLAAATFADHERLEELLASLDAFAGLAHDGTGLRMERGNELGNSVVAYALVQGPLWQLLARRAP